MISSCCVLLQSHECFTASFRHSPLYSLFSLIPIRTPDLFVFSFCIFWRPRSFYFWTLCASLSFASLASKHGIFLLSCTTRRQTQVCEKSRLLIWWPFPCHVLLSFFIFFSPHLFFLLPSHSFFEAFSPGGWAQEAWQGSRMGWTKSGLLPPTITTPPAPAGISQRFVSSFCL